MNVSIKEDALRVILVKKVKIEDALTQLEILGREKPEYTEHIKKILSKIFFICSVYSGFSRPRISSCVSASSIFTFFTSITRRASSFIDTFMEFITYPTDPTA
jgi:hypothetical protein